MDIKVYQNRETKKLDTEVYGTQNENNITKLKIEVPEQYRNWNKRIVFITEKKNFWDIITSDEYIIKNNITKYWNIDADDTFISDEAHNVVKMLQQVSEYAIRKKIEAFSLDMHHSFSNAHHWSYGITFTQNPRKWVDLFKNFDRKQWENEKKQYLKWEPNINIDWFTTWLMDSNQMNIKTFYIDNLYFNHAFMPLLSGHCSLALFKNNKIHYPVFEKLYNIDTLGISYVDIAKDDIKFDFNLSEKKSFNFYLRYFVELNHKYNVSKVIFNKDDTLKNGTVVERERERVIPLPDYKITLKKTA